MFNPDPGRDFLPIPDSGVNKAPDPGLGSATLHSVVFPSTSGEKGCFLFVHYKIKVFSLSILKSSRYLGSGSLIGFLLFRVKQRNYQVLELKSLLTLG
jgi:hypothetical protein